MISNQSQLLFTCNFDDYSPTTTNVCGGTLVSTVTGGATATGLELSSLLNTDTFITDFTSLSV